MINLAFIGGYVIMDDWAGFPLKVTCKDFFAVHGINHESISNYFLAVYKKIEQVLDMKYWRYKHNQQNFKVETTVAVATEE
jgi:hypothetical protein